MLDRYVDQARLLIDVLPHIAQEEVFALKGGTAINLFYRDMPRLSVDIDLTYLPVVLPAAPPPDAWYSEEFTGMTRDGVSKEALEETRLRLHADIRRRLTGDIASFLLSLHDAKPAFDLIGLPAAARLPAVRWKLANVATLIRDNPEKHAAQRNALKDLF